MPNDRKSQLEYGYTVLSTCQQHDGQRDIIFKMVSFDHIVWYLVCMRSLHKLLKIIMFLCGTSNWDYHSIIMYTMMIGQVQDTEFA